ncbi:hypothetical protein SFRURICE_002017, partial [Spodoptera frugiperda]
TKNTISRTHDPQARSNNLLIKQKVSPCGNRTRCPLYDSQLAQPLCQPCSASRHETTIYELHKELPRLGIELATYYAGANFIARPLLAIKLAPANF